MGEEEWFQTSAIVLKATSLLSSVSSICARSLAARPRGAQMVLATLTEGREEKR